MKKFFGTKALAALLLLVSCSKESPELIPCMCDGSESTLGLFDCMCEPMKKKPVKRFSYLQDTSKPRYQTLIIDEEQQDAYLYLHQRRNYFAPVKLEYVDFRIKKGREYENYSDKLGNYRFRIFGCRREAKNVFLNEGRAMQKDMKFFDVFFETMNDYYPVVVDKRSPYWLESDRIETPEYIMTAEITDYFMNICDEFDWENVKQKKLRSGSSEITVVWRVMSLDKSEVYCKGMTTGYGQISEGEPNGETLLVERAFEDALTKVPEIQCFNRTLVQRIRQEEITRQLTYLRQVENKNNSIASQYAGELKGIEMLQECNNGTLSANRVVIPRRPKIVLEKETAGHEVVLEQDAAGHEVVLEPVVEMQSVVTTTLEPFADVDDMPVISESSGIDGSGAVIDSVSEVSGSGSQIEMTSETTGSGTMVVVDEGCRQAQITEDGGIVVENVTENAKVSDDFWVDIPLDVEDKALVENRETLESSFANIDNRFCIKNQPPYENMNPQNLYKVRASIVSVENAAGKKGSGLIVADNLVLTSADLIVKGSNNFKLKTINGKEMKGAALRVNPNKNVALLLLDQPTQFTPLPLSLSLPEVNKDILMTLGLLDLDSEGEGYLDNEGKVIGYRWSEDGDAEIIVDTFVQTVSLGGALIDRHGNIVGMAHKSRKDDDNPDLFVPIESALKGLGLEICGREFGTRKPAGFKATPLADAIDRSGDKAPKPMRVGGRK